VEDVVENDPHKTPFFPALQTIMQQEMYDTQNASEQAICKSQKKKAHIPGITSNM